MLSKSGKMERMRLGNPRSKQSFVIDLHIVYYDTECDGSTW
jgi:hypothetical protein